MQRRTRATSAFVYSLTNWTIWNNFYWRKYMTWFQLWKKIGKQPLRLTQHNPVTIKIQDKEYQCKIVYTENGKNWHLEVTD
jgi:hypothetical protein